MLLMIDNYDSFTYNLVQYFGELGEDIRVLGVCLGHQSMGAAYGGKIIRAPKLMHGKTSVIHHDRKTIFRDLPEPFEATRYHSLIIDKQTLPDCFEITAWTDDDEIMGIRHHDVLMEGVQFHPESILTAVGKDLLKNFLKLG
jgi:anthranilate synthase/aminodeoxychorismate synthase-like glutamine amidotransferase